MDNIQKSSDSFELLVKSQPDEESKRSKPTPMEQNPLKSHAKLSSENIQNDTTSIIRGKPKSGRIWKTQKERFAAVKNPIRRNKTHLQMAYREEIKQIKQLSQSIKESKRRENEEKRLRREENKRRKLENERKSEIVQIINNPMKLKRLRKKHLRKIEKRDLGNLNVV